MEEDLLSHLLADSGLSALVSNRIHPGSLPQQEDAIASVEAVLKTTGGTAGFAYEANRISAQKLGQAQAQAAYVAQNAYASMASDIAGTLEQVFGKSKAVAIASALINTYEGFTKALAAYPPPINYAAAAASGMTYLSISTNSR